MVVITKKVFFVPQKFKKELIFGDFEHFRSNINTSLLDVKMIFLENIFLQKVTLIYDYNIVQKKVGVT